jgi:hypothetical protein
VSPLAFGARRALARPAFIRASTSFSSLSSFAMSSPYTVSKPDHKFPFWSVVDDYALALGQLSMGWAALDHTLQETFQWILGTDVETAAIMASGLDSIESRATPIKKLLVHHNFESDQIDFINKLLNRVVNEIGPLRNRHIHDRWWLTEGGMKRVDRRATVKKPQSRQRPSLDFNSEKTVNLSEIEQLTEYIYTIEIALWHLNIQLHIWRNKGWPPRYDKRWYPACKEKTRLARHPSILQARPEWPEPSDFQTD